MVLVLADHHLLRHAARSRVPVLLVVHHRRKTSSFIGPFVSSAIIDASPGHNDNSAPFYFLFALTLVSAIGLWLFLDLDKSAREQEAFIAQEKARMTALDSD